MTSAKEPVVSDYCEKCKGKYCSCGVEYSTSNSASDQATGPREGDCSCAYLHCEMVTQDRYDALSAELASYKKAKAENDERFQLRIGELEAERERKEKWIEQLEARLEGQDFTRQDLRDKIAELEAEWENKERDYMKACEQIDALRTERDTWRHNFDIQCTTLASAEAELKSAVSQYQGKVSELKQKLEAAEDWCEKLAAKLDMIAVTYVNAADKTHMILSFEEIINIAKLASADFEAWKKERV